MSPGQLDRDLERLPGVLAATVFTDRHRGPLVYLAVQPTTDPDAIRATTLALLRDHGQPGHPDRIRIGTAPTTTRPGPLPPLTFHDLEVHRTASRVQCLVRLDARGEPLRGTASETDSLSGRARAAARATLAAVETIDPDLRLGLHGARSHDLFGFRAVTVLLEASYGRSHAQLPGTAIAEVSLEHAAAEATLQALRAWAP